MTVEIKRIDDFKGALARDFLNLPDSIYNNDSNWIRPLDQEIKKKLCPEKSAFYKHARVVSFLAYDGSTQPLGRITYINNSLFNKTHNEQTCFFGLFEAFNNYEVSQALFNAVKNEAIRDGLKTIIGPVNLSTNDESGFLLDRFDLPPTFMCPYTKNYYHELAADFGFTKAIDTNAFIAWHGHPFPQKYYRLINKISSDQNIEIRKINLKQVEQDIMTIAQIYNRSFSDTWGFVPITMSEALEFGKSLIPFVDDELIWIASYNRKPVGAILGVPNINELIKGLNGKLSFKGFYRFLFRKKKITGMRIIVLGVDPEYRRLGLETVLINKVHQRVHHRPYQRSEFSVVLDNNHKMKNLLERFGFEKTQTFRIYRMDI